jgi:hypothetical protein
MGRRQGRYRQHDEQISAPRGGVSVKTGPAGKSLSDHVLSLQRDYGNTAVAGVVVQRTKHKTLGAASTDIKDVIPYKAPKGGGKKAPEEPTFWPKANPRFKDSDLSYLTSEALKWAKSDDPGTLSTATEFLEEVYLRTKARMWSDILAKSYAKMGPKHKAEAAFWLKVTQRILEPPF